LFFGNHNVILLCVLARLETGLQPSFRRG